MQVCTSMVPTQKQAIQGCPCSARQNQEAVVTHVHSRKPAGMNLTLESPSSSLYSNALDWPFLDSVVVLWICQVDPKGVNDMPADAKQAAEGAGGLGSSTAACMYPRQLAKMSLWQRNA